jgi:ATP-dependent Clp protease ATP-binding subunit ClpA
MEAERLAMANKLERFTQKARRVLSLAQEEAERLQHNYIGTEHLLLGLMREQEGVASKVLRDLGLEQRRVEELVGRMTRAVTGPPRSQLDLSPSTKRALELAVDEARRMGHQYIGTEHLLLGLVRQSEGVAIDVLKRLGVSPDEVRQQVQRVLQEAPVLPTPQTTPEVEPTARRGLATAFSLRVKDKLLPKLLSRLATEELHRPDLPGLIEELFSQVLSEESIVVTEELRSQLLESILAPFKLEEDKRRLRFRIVDKATGQVAAEGSLSMVEARAILRGAIEAVNTGKTGEVFVLNDDKWDIKLSIDDAPDAEAAVE